MSKYKYIEEFEINASAKIIYPFIDTASGLQEWFCPTVTEDDNNIYTFKWNNNEVYHARKSMHRLNKTVRYNFLGDNKEELTDPDYVDFQIETSELTQVQFLKITDYSSEADIVELSEMWHNLLVELKAVVGG